MSSSTPYVMSPEVEVRTFKQHGGESLKMLGIELIMLIIDVLKNIPLQSFLETFMWALRIGIDTF